MPGLEQITAEVGLDSKRYRRLRVIAAFQVVGGVIGLSNFYMMGGQVFTVGHLLLLSLVSFAFWAGAELWRGRRRGLKLSITCQSLQIPILLGSAFSYKCLIGPHLLVGYFPGQSSFILAISTEYFIHIGVPGIETGFGINLVALAFLVVLMRTSDSEYKDYCKVTRARAARENSEGDQ